METLATRYQIPLYSRSKGNISMMMGITQWQFGGYDERIFEMQILLS